jgi:putative addiction module component (TIGR02574 family)
LAFQLNRSVIRHVPRRRRARQPGLLLSAILLGTYSCTPYTYLMSNGPSLKDVLTLSAAERILLVEEIWDSLAASPDSVPVTETQKRELDERLESYRADPTAGLPWADVKNRITQGA